MISSLFARPWAAAAAFALGAACAWWVQDQRHGLRLEQLRLHAASTELASVRQAAQDVAAFSRDLNNALATYQRTQQRNAAAQQDLERSLRDMHAAASGLRGDFAGLPERIDAAARPSLARYASTCTALLEDLAERGGLMAQRGADIARAADGHAADARLMGDAWPRSKPANLP